MSSLLLKFIQVSGFRAFQKFACGCFQALQTNQKRPETNESGSRHADVSITARVVVFECRRPSLRRLRLNVTGVVFHNSCCSIELEKPLVVGEKLISVRRLSLAISLITLSVKLCLIYLRRFINYLLTRGIYGNNKLDDSKTNIESFFLHSKVSCHRRTIYCRRSAVSLIWRLKPLDTFLFALDKRLCRAIKN